MGKFSKQLGFTILELMMTIAIVGILAGIALPSYLKYTEKAKFVEVIQAASSYKTAVALCANTQGTLAGCSNGSHGIPTEQSSVGKVASITITDGIITANSQNLASNYSYTLTPTLDANNQSLTWTEGGTCKTEGIC